MPWTADAIIRDELFSIERLELHAASLASAQAVTARPPRRRSLDLRLKDNAAFLLAAYRALAGALREDLVHLCLRGAGQGRQGRRTLWVT